MATVLIIEDEKNIRQFVAVNLRVRGYDILQAESAEQGLDLIREHAPQALILDIKLPGLGGWGMLKVIHNDPALPKLPVIIMTASSVISQPDEYLYPFTVEKLIKPVALADLLRAVQKIPI